MIDAEVIRSNLATLRDLFEELIQERQVLMEALVNARDDLEAAGLQAKAPE